QGEELRAVLGPGAVPDPGGDAAGQHRQAVPAVGHTGPVDRQHEQGHRDMTTMAPPVVTGQATTGGGGAVKGATVTWMTLPALAVFTVFALLPLLGVVLLSFTTWTGLGPIQPSGFTSWRAE